MTKSYRSSAGAVPLQYETIGNCFDRIADEYAQNPALIVKHQGIRWTYQQYRTEVDRLATGLLQLGVEKGDRVGIWAPNCFEWCLTQFATAKIGAILVCINPAYRESELEYALNKVQCKILVAAEKFKTSDYIKMISSLAPELATASPGNIQSKKLPHLKTLIRLGDTKAPGMLNFADVCNLGGEQEQAQLAELAHELSPDDAINIQFTSGTTGNPKGATLTHFNILNNGNFVGNSMKLTAADKLCIPVPLYHCFGMVLGNLACVTHGTATVFPSDSFDPELTLQVVEEEQCTALHGVPTMFIAELELPNFARYNLQSLRTGIMAGSTCPVEVMKRVIDKMNMTEILIGYGQTEASPINHITEPDDPLQKRVETVGKPGPHLEIKIIDKAGKIVAYGEKGEICCRGYSVMRGYWDDPEKTEEAIDAAGWLHSGDIGVMDSEGYVQVTGRIKDMIIRGGENIYPREIEEFLYTNPAIQEVQVFGIPDAKYGEQVCAWIQLQEGEKLSEQDIKDFCKEKIMHFKIPRYIRFVDSYPMTVTGKIQKFIMREKEIEAMAQQ